MYVGRVDDGDRFSNPQPTLVMDRRVIQTPLSIFCILENGH
jgi:hypothetical protein